MGVMDEPVEDAIGQSGIANLFVPAPDWELRSQDRRAYPVAVFADLPEVAALGVAQGSHGPVIDHQHLNLEKRALSENL
jgi:hypothetical protein